MKAIIDYTIDVSSEYEGVDCVVPHENYIHLHGFAYGRVYSLDIQKRDILGVRLYYDGMRDTFEGGDRMTSEDLETLKEALKVIADKIIDKSDNLNYYCYGCKWEFDNVSAECNMCSRIRVDNYERREDG